MTTSLPKIELLPEHLIDQIKAGEVIERPGNLIKEILENAVDAGATKLELTLKNNGLDQIALKDNGHGMQGNDLPLAFSRHATSKISRFEDLYRLHSFGFRGEALASIAAISKLQCISFTANDKEGSELKIEGGHTLFHGPRQKSGVTQGTELVIQDLFFNTPARLKFIQSQNAEKQFIKRIIYAFILSYPKIEFHIKIDDDEKDIFPAAETLKERIETMVPKARGLILHTERFYENNELEIFLIPGHFKTPVKWQNIFINNRYILDKQFHRVISNALHASFGNDDFHYLAFFNVPADSIDVNVHPNKTIIKCMESSKLISLLTSTVRELSQSHRTVPVGIPKETNELPMPSFLPPLEGQPSLLQERHDYNMDGFFSPHKLEAEKDHSLIWIGSVFLKKTADQWLAISATKLLEAYVELRMNSSSASIPLLVSEPYPSKDVKKANVQKLINAGFEIEYLGSETLVLRSIPEWINGFPLKDVVTCLLESKSIQEMNIHPADWSVSSWEEMLGILPLDIQMDKKIVLDLKAILAEKFK